MQVVVVENISAGASESCDIDGRGLLNGDSVSGIEAGGSFVAAPPEPTEIHDLSVDGNPERLVVPTINFEEVEFDDGLFGALSESVSICGIDCYVGVPETTEVLVTAGIRFCLRQSPVDGSVGEDFVGDDITERDCVANDCVFAGEFDAVDASELTAIAIDTDFDLCLLYTSPSPRDQRGSRMPSSA